MTSLLPVFFLLLLLVKSCSSLQIPSIISSRITQPKELPEGNIDTFYTWKDNLKIHYVKTGDTGPILLLLPGFGVGTFHYENQLKELSGYQIYSFDLLGQGQSWPDQDSPSIGNDICFSADTWVEQTIYFIENIIKEPCHIAGNSLGGYLSVATSAARNDLIKSIILLNASPFWAFAPANPDNTNPGFFWNGVLPAPVWLLKFGSAYFDIMRNPSNVRRMLSTVYKIPAFDEELVNNIIASANRPGGHEAFTSILFAPKLKDSFDDMIRKIEAPLCLIYGKDDPWIKPLFAQRIKNIKPSALNFQLTPAGHCPHHESYKAVNKILACWIDMVEPSYTPISSDSSVRGIDTVEPSYSPISDQHQPANHQDIQPVNHQDNQPQVKNIPETSNTWISNRFLDGLVKHTIVENLSQYGEKMKSLVEGEYIEDSGAHVTVKLIDEY
mmetsp:Transcript_16110/g.15459  ORF Transcript_16110/g.15459 Transcript_16110/m.15459 type:complete len:441 (+) Transcript_16110:126-1448(+)